MLSAAVLVFLPKCPLCLAAWLTIATGIGFSPTGAEWVRRSIVLLWLAAVSPMLLRLVSGDAAAFLRRVHWTSLS